MNIGLASLNLFFLGGFASLLMIGDYDAAVSLAQNQNLSWSPISGRAMTLTSPQHGGLRKIDRLCVRE